MNTNYTEAFSNYKHAQFRMNVEGVSIANIQADLLRAEENLKVAHAQAYIAAKAAADKVTESAAEAAALMATKQERAAVLELRCNLIVAQAEAEATRRIRDVEVELLRAIAAEVA